MRSLAVPLLVVCLSALVGCGDDVKKEPAKASTSLSPTDAPSVSETPTEPPAPLPDTDEDGVPDEEDVYPKNPMASLPESIKVGCDIKGGHRAFTIDRVKPNWKTVWSTPLPPKQGAFGPSVYCESFGGHLVPVSPVEQAIYDQDKKPSRYTLRIPYEQCVEHGTNWTMNDWPVSSNQVGEASAALLLCPGHPDGAAIRSRIADLEVLQTELKQGRAFGDGNYRVGAGVQPGTYLTEDVENCYWERLDSTGNIIDNNFVTNAFRVEASISSGDFSFHTQGCGTWRAVK